MSLWALKYDRRPFSAARGQESVRIEAAPHLPPGHDYITIWRKADQSEFFVAGKYLHIVQVGEKVVALAYSELTKEEVDLVEQHIRVTLKVQNPVIKYYGD